jgi:hypothetical protein
MLQWWLLNGKAGSRPITEVRMYYAKNSGVDEKDKESSRRFPAVS